MIPKGVKRNNAVGVKGRSGTKKISTLMEKAMSNQAFVEAMKIMRDKIILQMQNKMDDADYRALNDSLDKMTKNIQLLSGESTENIKFTEISYDRAKQILSGRKGSDKSDLSE